MEGALYQIYQESDDKLYAEMVQEFYDEDEIVPPVQSTKFDYNDRLTKVSRIPTNKIYELLTVYIVVKLVAYSIQDGFCKIPLD